jgi:cytochrome c biogenesis protein CcmG/thiol:disulfide interchange protein DsbE
MKRVIAIFVAGLMVLGDSSSPGATKVLTTSITPIGKVVSCTTILHAKSVRKGTLLPCLDGGTGMSFESLRGPVVVNVWGSWCAPCVEEMPHFRALSALKKVRIVGIDVEERNMNTGKKFLLSHGMNWPILYDPDGRTKSIFGFGVPVTWFIDAAGKVAYKQIGTIHSDKIIFDLVRKYLKVKI